MDQSKDSASVVCVTENVQLGGTDGGGQRAHLVVAPTRLVVGAIRHKSGARSDERGLS